MLKISQLTVIPENVVSKSPFYMELAQQRNTAEQSLIEVTQEKTRILEELNNMKECRKTWEEEMHVCPCRLFASLDANILITVGSHQRNRRIDCCITKAG